MEIRKGQKMNDKPEIKPRDGLIFKYKKEWPYTYYILKKFIPGYWHVLWNSAYFDDRVPDVVEYPEECVKSYLNDGTWIVVE